MTLRRHDPYRTLRDWENRMMGRWTGDAEGSISSFLPAANTREDDNCYYVELDIPGLAKEDITVDVKNDTLSVSGERKFKEGVQEQHYYKLESHFGKFERHFRLSDNLETENIQAHYDGGVLTLILPKLKKCDLKKIEVS